jgi:hypothetical protein
MIWRGTGFFASFQDGRPPGAGVFAFLLECCGKPKALLDLSAPLDSVLL